MIAGQAAELRYRRQAEAEAKNNTDGSNPRPTGTDAPATGAIAEIVPGKAPTIRGVIPIRGTPPPPPNASE